MQCFSVDEDVILRYYVLCVLYVYLKSRHNRSLAIMGRSRDVTEISNTFVLINNYFLVFRIKILRKIFSS